MGYVNYSELKYDKSLYVGSGFLSTDMDGEEVRRTESLVRCNKPHECIGGSNMCVNHLNVGDYAVRVTSLFHGEGYKSCYICLPCIEQWLEESGQVHKSAEKLR